MTTKLPGYAGKLLRVRLSEGKIEEENLDARLLRQYLGGVGYAAKILYDELQPGVDPLGPNNKVVLATSPLTANKIPGGGSIEFCFKSPLTNGWGESRCGGDFGPALRQAGYDFVVIEGKSSEPVFLAISNDKVELRCATELVGHLVSQKTQLVRKDLSDPGFQVMCIGPGGENLVKYASVMYGGRAAGRCGGGAVLGSKNLLAIAIKGDKEVLPADPQRLQKILSDSMKVVREDPNTAGFKKHGTVGDIAGIDESGDLPTKNWQSNSWGKGEAIYDYFYHNNLVKNAACYKGCPVACGRKVAVKTGTYQTPEHDGAEYESIAAFTSFVLNDNVDSAVHSTYLCNEYGIDTISAGACIAFAMECFEHGIISETDLDGITLDWGSPQALPAMVKMIANRRAIGDLLAEGVKRAAEQLGKGSEQFAIHGKGLEAPAHDPRSGKALAVTYATANRGMCHIHPVEAMAFDSGKRDFGLQKHGLPDPESVERWVEAGKGRDVKLLQDALMLPDVFTTCKFLMYTGLTLEHYGEMLSALTGWDISEEELLAVGERAINLQRLFNLKEGFTASDDSLPQRMRDLPAFGGYVDKTDCRIEDLEGMLDEYYASRGWDRKSGVPTKEKLQELGIEAS